MQPPVASCLHAPVVLHPQQARDVHIQARQPTLRSCSDNHRQQQHAVTADSQKRQSTASQGLVDHKVLHTAHMHCTLAQYPTFPTNYSPQHMHCIQHKKTASAARPGHSFLDSAHAQMQHHTASMKAAGTNRPQLSQRPRCTPKLPQCTQWQLNRTEALSCSAKPHPP